MKDLLDELKKLDGEEFKVSPDFSKNVMKEIKKQDRNKKIMYVTSIASVACVLGISVFLAISFDMYSIKERLSLLTFVFSNAFHSFCIRMMSSVGFL